MSSGALRTLLIYYTKQKWHGISTGGDWVSIKHQNLIGLVLKRSLQGALLIQSSGPIRLDVELLLQCCMLISCVLESRIRQRRKVTPFVSDAIPRPVEMHNIYAGVDVYTRRAAFYIIKPNVPR